MATLAAASPFDFLAENVQQARYRPAWISPLVLDVLNLNDRDTEPHRQVALRHVSVFA